MPTSIEPTPPKYGPPPTTITDFAASASGFPPPLYPPLGLTPDQYDPQSPPPNTNVTHPLSQHAPGAKLDGGKPRVGLVLGDFALALLEVAKVGTAGAVKYSDHGWLSVPDGVSRYTDALGRHLLAEGAGEKMDPELGLLHAACAAWNALARLELQLRERA